MRSIFPPEPKKIYNKLKSSAKKRGIPFDLTITDLHYISYPLICPVLNIPMYWYRDGTIHEDSCSFDRIDSSGGYSIDNIQIISFKANRAKNNLSEKELKLFSEFFQIRP